MSLHDTDPLRRIAMTPRVLKDIATTRARFEPVPTADTGVVEFAVVVLSTLATCPIEFFWWAIRWCSV